MVRKHHQLNGHEFEQTLGDSEGQGSLVFCSPRGHKKLDTTEQLNNRLISMDFPLSSGLLCFKISIFHMRWSGGREGKSLTQKERGGTGIFH